MKSLFHFKLGHLIALLKAKLPLECIFVLEIVLNGEELPTELLSYQQRLIRKGYIDMKGNITQAGCDLYDSLLKDIEEVKVKKREAKKDEKFDEWWEHAFCSSNNFEIKGRKFDGTRKLTTDKEGCRKVFNALTLNEFEAEDVIRATAYHMNLSKDISYKTGANKLTYIPNSLRYLREKYFEPYIAPSKGGTPEQKIFEI